MRTRTCQGKKQEQREAQIRKGFLPMLRPKFLANPRNLRMCFNQNDTRCSPTHEVPLRAASSHQEEMQARHNPESPGCLTASRGGLCLRSRRPARTSPSRSPQGSGLKFKAGKVKTRAAPLGPKGPELRSTAQDFASERARPECQSPSISRQL